nr:MAG: ORF1 [Torque teno virus]
MAWRRWRPWGWRPRRRWRWRRRRRRPVRRRYRRPAGRRRKRRTVRRRRWRGGRRRYRGWRRRRYIRKRRRRKKIYLTQWNPAFVRRCNITGIIPLIICGQGRSSFNYGIHSDDCTPQPRPFGGGMATVTFSLNVLYDQFRRHLNRWSYSNEQLDLARYRGCRFKFFRDAHTDFIASFDTKPPMKMDQYTGPSTHPGMLMQQKHKILIPSFDTNPRGRKNIKVPILPPKLFQDKWYSQADLCGVPLVSLRLTAASLRFPFCSPQTVTSCTTFQVLSEEYNEVIGYSIFNGTTHQSKIDKFEQWLYGKCSHYQAFATEAHLRPREYDPQGNKITNGTPASATHTWKPNSTETTMSGYEKWREWWTKDFYATKADSNYGYCSFTPKDQQGINNIKSIRKKNFEALTSWDPKNANHLNSTYANGNIEQYEYHCGWFSSMFLSSHRYQLQFRTAYFDCTYNPLNDQASKNRIWFQYMTKADTNFSALQCKFVLEDLPLWCIFHGYADYVESQLGTTQDHATVGIMCVQCPYTCPPLYNKENPDMGYVVYDSNFGMGKTPEGYSQVPRFWAQRWRVYFKNQWSVMNDIDKTGPFAYRDERPSAVLTSTYKFRFNWGGDMMFPQVVKNPCGSSAVVPSTDRFRRSVQVVDPLSMAPQWIFHPFDFRRGFYNQQAIKRVSGKPTDDELSLSRPKKPRLFTESEYQGQEEGSISGGRKSPSSQEESEAEVQETADPVQQQLVRQFREQRAINLQLRELWVQLAKTQTNTHINPLLYTRT